jgi:hypothetical protein
MPAAVQSGPVIRLSVRQGSLVQTFALERDKAFVGRLPGNDVPIEDYSVSRKHCLIRRTAEGGLEVLDLNSRHGTLVNGKSVDRAPLSEGDEISVGQVRVLIGYPGGATAVQAPAPAAAPAPAPAPAPAADRAVPARLGKELISDAHRLSFSEQIYREVRRAPCWAASLFAHAAVLYIMSFVVVPLPALDTPLGAVDGRLDGDFSGLVEELPAPATDAQPMPDDTLEPPSPLENEQITEPMDDAPAIEDAGAEELLALGPAVVGDVSRDPMPSAPGTVEIPDRAFEQSKADDANREAVGLLSRSLSSRGGGGSLGLLRSLGPGELLVVAGAYDRVEDILDLLGLPYDTVTVRDLDRASLRGRRVVFVNCSNEAPSPKANGRLRSYVEGGGYLLGTDWAVENVMKRAFPEYLAPLERRGRNSITRDETISIHACGEARGHFLVEGTALDRHDARWWLEESSYPFRILDPKRVTRLIESEELRQGYGSSEVAATFRCGDGRVLHMLGHFYQKEGNLKGAFSAQRLVANFLLSAIRKR